VQIGKVNNKTHPTSLAQALGSSIKKNPWRVLIYPQIPNSSWSLGNDRRMEGRK